MRNVWNVKTMANGRRLQIGAGTTKNYMVQNFAKQGVIATRVFMSKQN
jgi:hypothetical protein